VLFTKMDETETLGAIVNLAHDYNLRGSYVTYGQNVPDDIEVLREERIVDMILGGRDHD
jgi:flagellar biosynthesis protein FlhF